MTNEATFLDSIDDRGTRAVYADWLEQHGDLARAEFMRSYERLIATTPSEDDVLTPGDLEIIDHCGELLTMSRSLPNEWLAAVSRPQLAGTCWHSQYWWPREAPRPADWLFMPDGRVDDPPAAAVRFRPRARWSQIGNVVVVDDYDSFVSYEGVIYGDRIRGHCVLEASTREIWRATRYSAADK